MNTITRYMKRLGVVIASLMLCSSITARAQWKFVAGVGGGHISTLQHAGDYLFAGTIGQGIYRSGDAGSSWTPMALPPIYSTVSAMASDGSIVYASIDNRIYRTLDDGLTWDTVGSRISGTGGDPMIVHGHSLFVGRGPGMIYRTDDSGGTWRQVIQGLPSTFDATMLAHDAGTLMAAGTSDVLYRSLDGEEWSEVRPDPGSSRRINAIFSVPGVFIASYDDGSLLRSTNGGAGWVRVSTAPASPITSVSGTLSDLHAASYTGIVSSADGGDHWQSVTESVPEGWFFYGRGAVLIEEEGKLLAGSMGGLLGSTDGGYTMRRYDEGIVGESFYCLTTNGDVMIAGGQHGTYHSIDGGSTWEAHDGMPGAAVSSIYTIGSVTIARCGFLTDRGTFQSADAGLTWDTLAVPLPESSIDLVAASGYLFTRGESGELYRREITASSWDDIGATFRAIAGDTVKVAGIFTSRRDLYVQTPDGRIYRSSDAGDSWQDVTEGLPDGNGVNRQIYGLTSDEGGTLFLLVETGFFRLDPSSTFWKSIPMGPFTSNSVHGLTAHDGSLYAALGRAGVSYLPNGGQVWRKLNDGFHEPIPGMVPSVEHLNVAGDQLFASTSYGLWRRSLASSGVDRDPVATPRIMVAPNPFATGTTIAYTTSAPAHVSLKVFDALGVEVAMLVDGYQEAGAWRIPFDGAGLPSGLYHYRLRIGGRSEAGTMSIVR